MCDGMCCACAAVGRDLGVAPRRIEAFLGDRRIVVEVDQIVRDAGMLRLAFADRLQDRRALELVGIGLVGRRSRGVERERVVDLRLVVVRDSAAPVASMALA